MFNKDSLIILPYRGFQSASSLYLHGRVIEDEGIQIKAEDGGLKTLYKNIRLFETDEAPGAQLAITYQNQRFEVTTDKEGYFKLDIDFTNKEITIPQLWHHVHVELLQAPGYPDQGTVAIGEVLTPNVDSEYGIISDVDDTVLATHMTSWLKLKMLHHTFTHNAHNRQAMEGMVDLYQQFSVGTDGKGQNPFFYLSDSPWNLYDSITTFMEVQQFPKGPVFLRDFGLHRGSDKQKFHDHKLVNLRRILGAYPELPFILLGDTASKDTDYYLKMAKEFPNRIKAIYIRQTRLNSNARRILKLIKEQTEVPLIIISNSAEIEVDARAKGLIQEIID